ncbi:MAG: aromatic ring-hydroxylating dioxygenase subunit alpha [Rhodospirillaceae bacterium]|nr:aromatic ring-hydroxylating dioxygenase subunit alpha [Rhodospirillaceae bacterium]
MILNNWYVAGETASFEGPGPFSVKMLGADLVLFRDSAGVLHCLSAVCCHRGAALAVGKVKGDCVACPYHGWEFAADGKCTKIPALGADAKIPKRARIDAYPLREKFGWTWVFMGDDLEQSPPFPGDDVYPEYDDPNWRLIRTSFELDVNWERSEENSIDGAHPTFVHKAFGSRRDPTVNIVSVDYKDWSASTTRKRTPPDRADKTGAMREITGENRGQNVATTTFFVCGIMNRTDILRADGVHQVQLATRTPIDEYNTRIYIMQARNYLKEPEHDAERLAGIMQARDEDAGIVQTVRPRLAPRRASHDLLTEADQLETAFRRKMKELTDKGLRIDSDAVERESKRQVFVIPSPTRKTDPKNWVHKPVPRYGAAPQDDHDSDVVEAAE